jgi:hypothetical protein
MDHCGQRRWQQHGAAAEVEVGFVVALVDVGGVSAAMVVSVRP